MIEEQVPPAYDVNPIQSVKHKYNKAKQGFDVLIDDMPVAFLSLATIPHLLTFIIKEHRGIDSSLPANATPEQVEASKKDAAEILILSSKVRGAISDLLESNGVRELCKAFDV